MGSRKTEMKRMENANSKSHSQSGERNWVSQECYETFGSLFGDSSMDTNVQAMQKQVIVLYENDSSDMEMEEKARSDTLERRPELETSKGNSVSDPYSVEILKDPTTVFFEETCLASKDAMPFDLLKKKLFSRLNTMGIRITKIYEEEWSYIPVGGSLPNREQKNLAFGAAACMVHPATGMTSSHFDFMDMLNVWFMQCKLG